MENITPCFCILFMLCLCIAQSVMGTDYIRGTYNAWWVIIGVDKDIAEKMLTGLSVAKLLDDTFPDFPANKHPVLFEIGKEHDCGLIASPALRSDFLEFKFEIPFVTAPKSKFPVLNFKQRLFESSGLNSVSSELIYGLDASKANMDITETSYGIQYGGQFFKANFSSADSPLWVSAKDSSLLKPFEIIMDQAWFGQHGMKGEGTCAEHHYDFGTALIRPAACDLNFDKSIINPYFPSDKYHLRQLSVDNAYGAVQIKINFTMTLPEKCFN